MLDKATLTGLLAGAAIIFTAIAVGSDPRQFLYLPAVLIVVGGTLAATLVKFSYRELVNSLGVARNAFVQEQWSAEAFIPVIKDLARVARVDGLLALDRQEVPSRFLRKGVQLCADGVDDELARKIMEEDLHISVERHETGQRFFRSIGEAAPAFGMIGTLVGLVHMLGALDDPHAIGPGMATALLTTLYGALFAHLVALPIADALEIRGKRERLVKSLIIEGLQGIREGHNPRLIEDLLLGYLPNAARDRFLEYEQQRDAYRRTAEEEEGG